MNKVITQQQIKYIRSLHQKKYRDKHRCFIAEGQKIINEAIVHEDYSIEMLVFTSRIRKDIEMNQVDDSVMILEVSSRDFTRLSTQKTPQEVLAVLRMPEQKDLQVEPDDKLIFAFDRIQDPGNMGTMLRLADWFGVKNILCSEDSVDVYNPKVIQSSMGAFLRLTLHYGNLQNVLKKLKEKKSFTLLAASLEGVNLYQNKYSGRNILILGNESSGISESLLSLADQQISIPNFSTRNEKTESLNVALAAAIICSEIRRVDNLPYSK